jgi:antibiotic biosynthesis monooxygenase (ABM) superfamily enzyme
MYGTVMRYRLKPGREEDHRRMLAEFRANPPGGFVRSTVYRLDADGDEYITAAAFTNKQAYVENADSPTQDAWFGKFRELLTDDVTWNDGEIVDEG